MLRQAGPLGGKKPLHGYKYCNHWLFLRSQPLQYPLQGATTRYTGSPSSEIRRPKRRPYGPVRLDQRRGIKGPSPPAPKPLGVQEVREKKPAIHSANG